MPRPKPSLSLCPLLACVVLGLLLGGMLRGAAIEPSGKVAHWRFDEGSGPVVRDATGRGHDAMLVNGPRWEGLGLRFSGRSDYLSVKPDEVFGFGGDDAYSIAITVKVHALTGQWSGVLTRGRDFGGWYGLWISPEGRWMFAHGGANLEGPRIREGVWSQVVATYDAGRKRLYIDGQLFGESNDKRDGPLGGALWIGGAKSVREYADLSIVDARIYTRALTAEDAANLQTLLWQQARLGGVTRDYWLNIEGTVIESLTTNHRFPAQPDGRDRLNRLEGVSWNDRSVVENWGDAFGERWRGYLQPAQSGDYVFFIAADDDAEFWLSTDERPENKRLLCAIRGYSGMREWNRIPEQRSAVMFLEAGRRYYLEVLHKEHAGGDHCSVGWARAREGLTGADEIVPGEVLRPFEE